MNRNLEHEIVPMQCTCSSRISRCDRIITLAPMNISTLTIRPLVLVITVKKDYIKFMCRFNSYKNISKIKFDGNIVAHVDKHMAIFEAKVDRCDR